MGLLFKVEDSADLSKKILYYNENKIHLKKFIKLGFKKLDRFDYYFNLKKYLNLIKNYKNYFFIILSKVMKCLKIVYLSAFFFNLNLIWSIFLRNTNFCKASHSAPF